MMKLTSGDSRARRPEGADLARGIARARGRGSRRKFNAERSVTTVQRDAGESPTPEGVGRFKTSPRSCRRIAN